VFSRHDDYRVEIIRSRIKRYRREIDYNGLRSKSNPASWRWREMNIYETTERGRGGVQKEK
jgi:hypothetical protein